MGSAMSTKQVLWRKVLSLQLDNHKYPCADVDIAYSTKPLWASYLRYIEDARADGAMAHELGKVKGGSCTPGCTRG
mgnify:CR=1 FL=1